MMHNGGTLTECCHVFIKGGSMSRKEEKHSDVLTVAAHTVAAMLCAAVLLAACSGEKTEVVEGYENIDSLPTLYTRGVNTLISDSGITRYRIVAAAWYMYDNAEEPYWYFPEGLYVEQFDTLFNPVAFIQGDTATHYRKRQVWQLDGNVHIENTEGRQFDTPQLFWDQKERRIYSDAPIRITSKDEIIEGIGFVSNEQITKYSILRTSGIFTIKKDTVPADTIAPDTSVPDSAAVKP